MRFLIKLFVVAVVILVFMYGLSTSWGTLDIDLIPPKFEWTPK